MVPDQTFPPSSQLNDNSSRRSVQLIFFPLNDHHLSTEMRRILRYEDVSFIFCKLDTVLTDRVCCFWLYCFGWCAAGACSFVLTGLLVC